MRLVAIILAGLFSASLLNPTTSAQAATAASSSLAASAAPAKTVAQKRAAKKKRAVERRHKIVRVAARYKGTPYRWGGTSPSGFDCSGYVRYVVKKSVKRNLPRIAGDQMRKGWAVPKSKKRKGDLIGFTNGSGYYHIGIYAGKGKIWHAPRSGESVKREKIWTSNYRVRRL